MWCLFGVMLAVLSRGPTLAIGLGLVWTLVLESFIRGVGAGLVVLLDTVRRALPGVNAGSLATAVGAVTQAGGGAPGVVDSIGGLQAALVLAGYAILFALAGGLVFRRRDVT
jgi:ABC-2 type transport system permease protein